MAAPHRRKTDPVPLIVLALIVSGLLSFVVLDGAWTLRSLRLRLQAADRGPSLVLISKQTDDLGVTCGTYAVPSDRRPWRYLDRPGFTWAERGAPLAALPAEVVREYQHCDADNPLGRRAVGGAFVPLQRTIANAWR